LAPSHISQPIISKLQACNYLYQLHTDIYLFHELAKFWETKNMSICKMSNTLTLIAANGKYLKSSETWWSKSFFHVVIQSPWLCWPLNWTLDWSGFPFLLRETFCSKLCPELKNPSGIQYQSTQKKGLKTLIVPYAYNKISLPYKQTIQHCGKIQTSGIYNFLKTLV